MLDSFRLSSYLRVWHSVGHSHQIFVTKQVSLLNSSTPIRVLSNAYLRGWIVTERILRVIIYIHDISVLHLAVHSTALGIASNIKRYSCTGTEALYRPYGPKWSRLIALLFLDHGTRRGWGVSLTPRPLFTPGEDLVPIVQEVEWAPGPVWTVEENLAPTGIRSPNRPARSLPLYRLSYPSRVQYEGKDKISPVFELSTKLWRRRGNGVLEPLILNSRQIYAHGRTEIQDRVPDI